MAKLIFIFFLCACATAADSTAVDPAFTASVRTDSTAEPILVQNVLLQLEFRGVGVYFKDDYPTLPAFPMENGEIIRFENVRQAFCRGERVFWRKFVQPELRSNYTDVDAEGYRRYSDVEVRLKLIDYNGKITEGLLKRPDFSDVFLIGKTERGEFRLQLDQENGKTVEINFRKASVRRCKKSPDHIFWQPDYRYCPYCGEELISETTP